MESLHGDLPHVCMYLDDILVTGESETAHLRNLASVLERLTSARVRLKREKCAFMILEVEYLGHRISAEGIYPVPEKVIAVREAPTPKDVSQLRSFLGLVNYYWKFLPNVATLLRPLYDLLQSARGWSWGNFKIRPSVRPRNCCLLHPSLHTMTPTSHYSYHATHLPMEWVLCYHTSSQTIANDQLPMPPRHSRLLK